jgi:ribosomal protein S18 acetylase RimI-like enzyme
MSAAVRPATLSDLEQLVPLFDAYRQFYAQPSDPGLARRFLRERISKAQSVVLIAEAPGSKAVGFVQLYPSFSSTRAAPIFVLNDLFVAPDARRHGLGALLLKAAARTGREAGAVGLVLSTAVTNLTAQRLYEALGWQRETEFYEYRLSLTGEGDW